MRLQFKTPARPWWLAFAAIALVSFLASMPGLFGSWVGDDFHMVNNPYYGNWTHVWDVFTRNAGHYLAADGHPTTSGPYRPVTMFTLLLPHALVPKPWLHHLVSWVLHIATGALVYVALLRQASSDARPSARAVMLFLTGIFLLHPVAVEAYVWINGRSDLVAGFFLAALGAVLLRRWTDWRWRAFAIAPLAFLGAASKLPFVLAAVALWLGVAFRLPDRRFRWSAGVPLFAGIGFYLILRWVYVPFFERFGAAENILSDRSVWAEVPQLLAMSADALLAFRAEAMHSLAWELHKPLSTGEWVGAAALLAAGLGLAWRRDIGGLAYFIGAALTIAPCVVVSQAIWLGFARYLYMPSILLLLAGAPYVTQAVDSWSQRRALVWVVAAAVLLVAAIGTRTASLAYVNQTTYEHAMLTDHADDPTIFFYYARTSHESAQPELARQALTKMPPPPWPEALVMPAFILGTELSDFRTRDIAMAHALEAHSDNPVLRAHAMRWKYKRGEVGDALALALSFDVGDPLCPEVRRQLELWSRQTKLEATRHSIDAAANDMRCAGDPD
jgi:hypothetical protein